MLEGGPSGIESEVLQIYMRALINDKTHYCRRDTSPNKFFNEFTIVFDPFMVGWIPPVHVRASFEVDYPRPREGESVCISPVRLEECYVFLPAIERVRGYVPRETVSSVLRPRGRIWVAESVPD